MTETTTPATVGQTLDADLAVLKAKVALLEADAKTDWADVVAWVKAEWPHAVTWAGGVALAAKAGLLHFL